MNYLQQIIENVTGLLVQKQPVLLAIDGYGGAGKTTLAKESQGKFPGSTVITLDDFATDTESGADRKRFLAQVLMPLTRGNPSYYQRFDWREKVLGDWLTVEPKGLIIIEGVSVIGEDFSPFYDFRVWIDCPHELASKRGKERDRNVYNIDDAQMWKEIWIKEEQEYGKTEPWKRADLIVKAWGT